MELQDKLQDSFNRLEDRWQMKRPGAEIATKHSVDKLNAGETILFLYTEWMETEPVDKIMRETGAVGQFDLGIQSSGLPRGYQLLHIWKP